MCHIIRWDLYEPPHMFCTLRIELLYFQVAGKPVPT